WQAFHAWRETVNLRLETGNRHFTTIFERLDRSDLRITVAEQRLDSIEERICPLGERCPAVEAQRDGDKKAAEPDGDTVITWKFVREKLAVPVVVAFVTWLLLTVLPQVIQSLFK
ncbi:MAG: hypothetical protein JW862_13100, partial [Anaerolineales bacterium]|nr:hypothetical protein [Anaerolineales bacterium]